VSETTSGFTQPAVGLGPTPSRVGPLAARDFVEVRFGGTRDQGVVLMGVVVATAATRDHRYVTQTQAYGLEDLGGHGHSDVIISDNPVDYPELQAADLLVALCQAAADDSEKVTEPPHFGGESFGIPFARLAAGSAGRGEPAPDLLALGAVVGITGVVSVHSLQKALAGMTAAGLKTSDKKALSQGLALDPSAWRKDIACS
jgi:2-oxoglutarate ferredoxin oxidoreductase subunit gamma